MIWFDWVLLGLWVINILAAVSMIGKPRKALDAGTVMWMIIIYGLLITGLILTRTG